MFSAAWICSHHVLLSVIMSALSVVGVALGIGIVALTLYGFQTLCRKIFSESTREKIGNVIGFLAAIFTLLFLLFMLFLAIKQDWEDSLYLLACLVICVPLTFGIWWLLKKTKNKLVASAEKVPVLNSGMQKITKSKSILSNIFLVSIGILAVCILLFMIGMALHDLYQWWILHICGM